MTYAPDLSKASTLQYLRTEGVQFRNPGQFGSGLYLTGSSGTVDVPIKSAYPVVGGRLEVDLERQHLHTDEIAISISYDGGNTWKDVQTSWASDYNRMYVDLNPFFKKKDPARYEYILRFTLRSQSAQAGGCVEGSVCPFHAGDGAPGDAGRSAGSEQIYLYRRLAGGKKSKELPRCGMSAMRISPSPRPRWA